MHPPSDLSTARVIVTGAGAGLGRAYCLDLANAGVGGLLVNDINGKNAEAVASEIRILSPKTKVGVNTSSIAPESGGAPDGAAKIVEDCMRYLGGPPTGLVNNAGILRDVAFKNQSDEQWRQIYDLHLLGVRNLCKKCWPLFLEQKRGKIVNVSSMNGICGAYGQTNYASMKTAILGFSKSLAKEGKKQNIHVNVIIPTALTAMTKTVGLQHYTSGADPGHIAPLVTYLLCSASDGITGRIFEAGPGFYAEIKFQRSGGVYFPELGTEQVRQKPVDWKEIHQYWDEITEFGENCDDPAGEENAVPRSLKLVLKMPEVVNDTGTKRQKSKL